MNDKPIVIVGAGLAGLTSAAYLTKEGYEVTLIEKNEDCGGLLNSFNYRDFIFDVGARSIENSGIVKPLFKDLGIDIEFEDSLVSIGIEDNVISFTNLESIKSFKDLLITTFPNNINDIDIIFKQIYKITKSMEIMYGFDNPIFKKDFTKDKEYLIHELLPWFPKFVKSVLHMNRLNKPVELFLQKYTKNQSLIDMISQHFFKNTSTFFALGYFYVYQDYIYPKNGTGEVTKKLKEKALIDGLIIKNNTTIVKINPIDHNVIDDKGNIYSYSNLIWASNLNDLYSLMNTKKLNKKVYNKFTITKEKLLKSRGGDSVFSIYLGIDKPVSYFSDISNGHFFYTPNKKGLNNIHTSKLNDIIINFESYSKEQIINWIDQFFEFNTFEISIPSIRNEKLSPNGKTGLIASVLFEYDFIKKIEEANWYDEFKAIMEDKIIEVLSSSIYLGLNNHILFKFSYTPLTIQKRVNTSQGAITGWTYERETPVVNKLFKIGKAVITPINDIYQAGQWAYSPAGIPTSILTGKYAADTIINKNKK
ncbi:MAG: phytoene desaturase family protein [Pleomorphochaeta sp.]